MRFLSHDQVAVLANAAGECRPDGALIGPPSIWRLVILFLAYTGLRWGELAALQVSDLDLLHRRAIVERSYSPVRGQMVLSDTKGHARREVPIPKFLVADLEAHIRGRAPGDLLFTGPKGAILRSQSIESPDGGGEPLEGVRVEAQHRVLALRRTARLAFADKSGQGVVFELEGVARQSVFQWVGQ